MKNRHMQTGFTLLEFMIGSTVGMIVMLGVLTMYNVSVGANTDMLRTASLNQELRASVRLMVDDFRRAGYWAGVPGVDDMTENPFQTGDNDLNISSYEGVANSCITYSYDIDKDKLVGDGTAGAALEMFGLRLAGDAIQIRVGGTELDCDSGNWQRLSNRSTTISALNFQLVESCWNLETESLGCPCSGGDPCQYVRGVDITVSAQSKDDELIQGTITESVRVRNDKFVAEAP